MGQLGVHPVGQNRSLRPKVCSCLSAAIVFANGSILPAVASVPDDPMSPVAFLDRSPRGKRWRPGRLPRARAPPVTRPAMPSSDCVLRSERSLSSRHLWTASCPGGIATECAVLQAASSREAAHVDHVQHLVPAEGRPNESLLWSATHKVPSSFHRIVFLIFPKEWC